VKFRRGAPGVTIRRSIQVDPARGWRRRDSKQSAPGVDPARVRQRVWIWKGPMGSESFRDTAATQYRLPQAQAGTLPD